MVEFFTSSLTRSIEKHWGVPGSIRTLLQVCILEVLSYLQELLHLSWGCTARMQNQSLAGCSSFLGASPLLPAEE